MVRRRRGGARGISCRLDRQPGHRHATGCGRARKSRTRSARTPWGFGKLGGGVCGLRNLGRFSLDPARRRLSYSRERPTDGRQVLPVSIGGGRVRWGSPHIRPCTCVRVSDQRDPARPAGRGRRRCDRHDPRQVASSARRAGRMGNYARRLQKSPRRGCAVRRGIPKHKNARRTAAAGRRGCVRRAAGAGWRGGGNESREGMT